MVVAASAASGKTFFCAKHPEIAIDLECMPFKYKNFSELSQGIDSEEIKAAYELELRCGWAMKYFEAVKEMEKATPNLYIFIPPDHKVLYLLKTAGIKYWLVYPKRELLPEYIKRCRNRGNSEDFIHILETCWDTWISTATADNWANKIELHSGQYLTDVVKIIR